jgi:hypothetical protein
MIKINDQVIDRFCADQAQWQGTYSLDFSADNSLKIEHYGKNYVTDSVPDRYFELLRLYVNDVDLKHHLYNLRQTAYLPPWDTQPPPDHSLYLGHNGYLELGFSSPINAWIQGLFGIDSKTMHGQATTRAVLDDVKASFGF